MPSRRWLAGVLLLSLLALVAQADDGPDHLLWPGVPYQAEWWTLWFPWVLAQE